MNKRTRRRSSPWRITFLIFMIGSVLYINQFVIPNTPGFAVPTATPTISPEAFVNEAEAFFSGGKFLQAINAYEQAIRADPENKANYVALARVEAWAGKYEEALEHAELSLIGNETYSMGWAVRGWALNFLKDTVQADASIRRALELDPNNALAHAYYAEVLVNQGNFGDIQKAIDASRKAYDLAPDTLEALRARGYVLFITDNREDSIAMYEAAIAVNKYIPDLYLYLGYNYKALGDYGKAVDNFMLANTYNPSDSVPDLEISRIYMMLGSFEKAVQWAENAVSDDPTNPRRYANLGVMHYRNGDYNAAIDAFTMAIRGGTTEDGIVVQAMTLENSVADYYYFYGFSLARVTPHRCGEAVPVFQALVNGLPDNQFAVEQATIGMEECAEKVGILGTGDLLASTP